MFAQEGEHGLDVLLWRAVFCPESIYAYEVLGAVAHVERTRVSHDAGELAAGESAVVAVPEGELRLSTAPHPLHVVAGEGGVDVVRPGEDEVAADLHPVHETLVPCRFERDNVRLAFRRPKMRAAEACRQPLNEEDLVEIGH